MRKQQSFVGSAFILLAAVFIVKIIGAVFKIPLTKILGGSGMGYFMTAYGVFNPIFAFAISGIPIAISKLTSRYIAAGKPQKADDILLSSSIMVPPFCFILSVLVFVFADEICALLHNPLAKPAVLAIAPSIFFVSVTAVIKGYFEGHRNMTPTALTQIAEALVKLFCGISLAIFCMEDGKKQYLSSGEVFGIKVFSYEQAMDVILPKAAACAICGVTISCAIGALIMLILVLRDTEIHKFSPSYKLGGCFWLLFNSALPVCLVALTVNLSSMVDLISIPSGLKIALENDYNAVMLSHGNALNNIDIEELPNFLYGCYTGMAMTLFNIIPAISACLGVSALPLVSGLLATKQTNKLNTSVYTVLKSTLFIATPCSVGLFVMADPILNLLFAGNVEEIAITVPLLQFLGIAAFFVSMTVPMINLLQALGRPYAPVKFMLVGSLFKWIISILFIRDPRINIFAAPIGTIVCYVFVFAGAFFTICKVTPQVKKITLPFLKVTVVSILSCLCIKSVYMHTCYTLPLWASFLASLCLGVMFYLIGLLILSFFDKDDFKIIFPNGNLSKTLAKCPLIR